METVQSTKDKVKTSERSSATKATVPKDTKARPATPSKAAKDKSQTQLTPKEVSKAKEKSAKHKAAEKEPQQMTASKEKKTEQAMKTRSTSKGGEPPSAADVESPVKTVTEETVQVFTPVTTLSSGHDESYPKQPKLFEAPLVVEGKRVRKPSHKLIEKLGDDDVWVSDFLFFFFFLQYFAELFCCDSPLS